MVRVNNILFLHPNFPAQFRQSCLSLSAKDIYDIRFLCQTHYGRNIEGVKKLVLKGRGSHERTLQASKAEHNRAFYRADAYREAFVSLRHQGWSPDVVISHCGWGCGLYVKDIWPDCRFIAYLEWWFDPTSDLQKRLHLNPYFQLSEATNARLTLRNLPSCYEMANADNIVSPTAWQRQQLPERLRDNCIVIHDHFDKNLFYPEPHKQSRTPVLTYGTRGMEPMRGFPEFISILPTILKKWPQLRTEIAGTDTISYGGITPPEGSWKKWALALLQQHNLNHRIVWKDRLPLRDYVNWLKGSWCHVYLSEPFVTSWSLIEACHCAVPMVATRSPATEEFSNLNPFLIQIDHLDDEQFAEAINNRIRFSSRFERDAHLNGGLAQLKSANFLDISLASYIADQKAPTNY